MYIKKTTREKNKTVISNCEGCGIPVEFKSAKGKYCRPCAKLKQNKKTLDRYHNFSEEQIVGRRKYERKRLQETDLRTLLLKSAKHRSTKYDQIFDLTLDDIIIPDVCPVFGTPFERKTLFGASLDRIDNSRGYCRGNVQVISRLANTMKNSATQEQLEKFAYWILNKKVKKMNETQVINYVTEELEERTFEEILEDHDLTPVDVFIMLFNLGHISEEVLEEQMRIYNFAD